MLLRQAINDALFIVCQGLYLLVENVDTNNLIYIFRPQEPTYEHSSVLSVLLLLLCSTLFVFMFVPEQAKLAAGLSLNGKANASSKTENTNDQTFLILRHCSGQV